MKTTKFLCAVLALLLAFSLSGCEFINNLLPGEEEPAPPPSEPEILEPVDPNWPVTAFGIEIGEAPEGVAIASPALAEYIFDMGLIGKVNAVCDHCAFGGASDMVSIGSVALPNLDAIREAAPRYILTFAQYENSVLIELQQMNISVIVIEAPQSLDAIKALYKEIALFFGGAIEGPTNGESYVSQYEAALTAAAYTGEAKSVAYLRAMDFMMITGGNMENELLTKLGFINAAEAETGYEYAYDKDKWKEFKPEIIFVNNDIHIIDLEESDHYKKKSAVKGDAVYGVDFDAIGICSMRSISMVKDMLATAYEDYAAGGTKLEPAYPSKYSK